MNLRLENLRISQTNPEGRARLTRRLIMDLVWVFASFKLKGKKPISGSQFVKDYIGPRFIEHGFIDAEYTGRAGLHAFRHSLATVLITEENVDPKTAQGILRHATSSMTMDVYTHAQDAVKRAALERYESRLVQ